MRDTLYMAVPAEAPGLTITGDWDPLGMRGTVSRTLILKDVFVTDDAQLMPRGVYYQAASRWPHMFSTLSPTYMGIAQGGLRLHRRLPARRDPRHAAGQAPHVRRPSRSRWRRCASSSSRRAPSGCAPRARRRVDPSKDERLRLYSAHYTIMENANDICRLAIRTCGGQSMLKTLPLERMYRDSRCGSLMLPWTAELCLDRIGREALYESGESDD